MKHRCPILFITILAMFLLASCAQAPLYGRDEAGPRPQAPSVSGMRTPAPSSPRATSSTGEAQTQGQVYIDARLGFQLTTPRNWQAQAAPALQAASGNSAVTFTLDEQSTRAVIIIGVFHGANMPAAFAERGIPTAHIGPYPAFSADRTQREARAPCLVRIFLAGNDYVMADWCAPDAFANRTQFEQVLATYRPAPASFIASHTTNPSQPQTCAGMQSQLGYAHALWGRQLASPTSTGWHQINPGLSICSNQGSNDWFLFQCTELVNRFVYEHFALPHLPGNAARYLDYYQNGVFYPGIMHTFPAGSYQLSDDASQGKSAFRPVAGDVLIFQDVNNPRVGWKSGLINSPGHVALIVGVDNAHVGSKVVSKIYIAQENYNETQYFLALPIHQVANGYAITDLSGWSQRIVRGWIHFTANGGALPTT